MNRTQSSDGKFGKIATSNQSMRWDLRQPSFYIRSRPGMVVIMSRIFLENLLSQFGRISKSPSYGRYSKVYVTHIITSVSKIFDRDERMKGSQSRLVIGRFVLLDVKVSCLSFVLHNEVYICIFPIKSCSQLNLLLILFSSVASSFFASSSMVPW